MMSFRVPFGKENGVSNKEKCTRVFITFRGIEDTRTNQVDSVVSDVPSTYLLRHDLGPRETPSSILSDTTILYSFLVLITVP